jgi:hypothetical protein
METRPLFPSLKITPWFTGRGDGQKMSPWQNVTTRIMMLDKRELEISAVRNSLTPVAFFVIQIRGAIVA